MGIPGALRPRTDPEILDASFALARRFWKELLPVSLAFQIPISLLVRLPKSVQASGAPVHGSTTAIRQVALGLLLTPLIDAVRLWLLEAALVDGIQSGRVDWGAARRRLRPVLGRLVGSTLAYRLLGFLSSLAFVIPGVIYYVHRRFYGEVLLVEQPAEGGGFRRSHLLTEGRVYRLAAILFAFWLLSAALNSGCTVVPGMHGWAATILTGCAAAGVSMAQAAFYLLLYYDLRARREGLDLFERDVALDARLQGAAAT